LLPLGLQITSALVVKEIYNQECSVVRIDPT
jgi:hypothetical protein